MSGKAGATVLALPAKGLRMIACCGAEGVRRKGQRGPNQAGAVATRFGSARARTLTLCPEMTVV